MKTGLTRFAIVALFMISAASGCLDGSLTLGIDTRNPTTQPDDAAADAAAVFDVRDVADTALPGESICGNGVLEDGERCDPPSSCPQTCDDGNACTVGEMLGSPDQCNARCVQRAIALCVDDDGCCPAGCTADDDSDCSATCGNGVIDDNESCDPPSSCPQSCAAADACTNSVMIGSAANCNARCSQSPVTECVSGDGCCPLGCTANNDNDCSANCGNGALEAGEKCDPPGSCPTSCNDGNACTVGVMTGSAQTCDAECTQTAVTACKHDDGCCPSGCTSANDNDCSASCGNGVVEAGETCDPVASCPTSCNDGNSCTVGTLSGSAQSCTASCTQVAITTCKSNDGCCPPGCNATNDNDCAASCGNGVVEAGETCDPVASCPTSCNDGNSCTVGTLSGSAQTCTSKCTQSAVTACTSGDGCCPAGCTAANDTDCVVDCKNPASWPTAWKNFETEVITQINQRRAQGANCGGTNYPAVPAVKVHAALTEAARCHSVDMGQTNNMSHTGSDGSTFSQRIQRANYPGSPRNENVAAGYSTPTAAVNGWMNSSGHCKNIMASNTNEVGIGYFHKSDSTYKHWWTGVGGFR
ncbi:MAG: CAP domain-containing protein [Bradymonadaceae bacterium]|nr:CAP domain-containing protein [Lujinxingiaceae bacterium]